jgi:hypothetical protein
MIEDDDGRPSHKPLHNSFAAQVQYLDQEMTPREIAEAIEALSFIRGQHALLVDVGVRQYLLNLLKNHLPPNAPTDRPTQLASNKRCAALSSAR